MLAFVKKILSTIMNAIIYGVIFVSIVGGALYAAGGTRSISIAGIDFIDFFTQGGADGSAGVQASAFHSVRNDSWLPYPGNNQNYIRGATDFQYGNVTIADSLCLGGVCKNSWPSGGTDTATLATNGWTKLPSGLILQWGKTTSRGDRQTQYFNTKFPNGVFFISVGAHGRDWSGNNGFNHIGTYDTEKFTYTTEPTSGGSIWFAIGY